MVYAPASTPAPRRAARPSGATPGPRAEPTSSVRRGVGRRVDNGVDRCGREAGRRTGDRGRLTRRTGAGERCGRSMSVVIMPLLSRRPERVPRCRVDRSPAVLRTTCFRRSGAGKLGSRDEAAARAGERYARGPESLLRSVTDRRARKGVVNGTGGAVERGPATSALGRLPARGLGTDVTEQGLIPRPARPRRAPAAGRVGRLAPSPPRKIRRSQADVELCTGCACRPWTMSSRTERFRDPRCRSNGGRGGIGRGRPARRRPARPALRRPRPWSRRKYDVECHTALLEASIRRPTGRRASSTRARWSAERPARHVVEALGRGR